MIETDPTIRLVTSLWHSNFRHICMDENMVIVKSERFGANGLALLAGIANTHNCNVDINRGIMEGVEATFTRRKR